MKLKELKFSDFFKWLSASMSTATELNDNLEINLPNPSDWMDGFKI